LEWRNERRIEEIKAAIEELSGAESVYIKKCVVCKFWSARAGLDHRALAVQDGADYIWVWIGSHDAYKRLLKLPSWGIVGSGSPEDLPKRALAILLNAETD